MPTTLCPSLSSKKPKHGRMWFLFVVGKEEEKNRIKLKKILLIAPKI
jgi:hypothetical protein